MSNTTCLDTDKHPPAAGRTLILLLVTAQALLSGCATRDRSSALRLNQIQVIGTHNSYHQRAPDSLLGLIAQRAPGEAPGLDYSHRALPEQLTLGIRQLELDCFADPKGGLYASPRGPKWVAAVGLPPVPNHDPDGRLRKPGFKVIHVQDVDYFSTALTLVDGLRQVRDWSAQNPRHLPIFILIEPKDDRPSPDLTSPVPFDASQLVALEQEILSVFPRKQILAPDEVRRGAPSLPSALRKYGWPRLDSVRGKVMFGLDNEGALRDDYLQGHPALEGRLLFVSVAPTNPAAAWMKENDPVEGFTRIHDLVRQGFLVRTRADADTVEARRNDTRRRDQAFASGAQFISTDYPEPNAAFSPYAVRFEGGALARVNAVNATNSLRGQLVGTWRLVSASQRFVDGTIRPDPQTGPKGVGYLIYTETGQLCVVVGNAERTRWQSTRAPTEAELRNAFDGLVAYAGTFTVNEPEGYVVHHIEVDRVPNLIGTDRKRFCSFSGNRLILSAAPPLPADVKEWTIVWERVGNQAAK